MTVPSEFYIAIAECFACANQRAEEYHGFLSAGSPAQRLQYAAAAGVPLEPLTAAINEAGRDGFDLGAAAHLVNYILLAAIAGKQEQSNA
ncbi:hypothetical protein [Rhodoligotrophos ferricapiens]|uniref:hypothetical protein n=1 Tax=Rhodoligotrophos ferricapiens TaxID=3069264 RepID=UPI00315D3E1A